MKRSHDDSLVAAMAAAPKKCPNVTCSDLGSTLRSRYCSALSNCGTKLGAERHVTSIDL